MSTGAAMVGLWSTNMDILYSPIIPLYVTVKITPFTTI